MTHRGGAHCGLHNCKNKDQAFYQPCPACHGNTEQKADIILSAEIKKMKQPFLKTHDTDALLVSVSARDALCREGFQFKYRPIFYRTADVMADNLNQLVIDCLPPAVINPPEDYVEQSVCPNCGTQYSILSQYAGLQMDENRLKSLTDGIYYSAEYFGTNALGHALIITGAFYRCLQKLNLAGGLQIQSIIF